MTGNNLQYPRDMVGYGRAGQHPRWPNSARIAVQFVINYEEGGESNILHGDASSETFLSEIIGAQPCKGMRHANMESIYEFGSRAGFWRLHRLFTRHQVPVTVFAVAMAMKRHPAAIEAMLEADWEIASHGLRWIDYQSIPEALEIEHLHQAVEIHNSMTGNPPEGFYLGRSSPNTHRITAEYGNFLYSADSYADELPYWLNEFSRPLLVVPYTLDTNDMRFATTQGFNNGEQFFTYLKDSFDMLYAEGESAPKMLSVGLHCRLAGRPGRAAAVARFIDYILQFDHVWLARRSDIAHHWKQQFPAP